jgi:hypothetical protein
MDLQRRASQYSCSIGYISVLTAFITSFASGVAHAAAMLRLLEKVSIRVSSFERSTAGLLLGKDGAGWTMFGRQPMCLSICTS